MLKNSVTASFLTFDANADWVQQRYFTRSALISSRIFYTNVYFVVDYSNRVGFYFVVVSA